MKKQQILVPQCERAVGRHLQTIVPLVGMIRMKGQLKDEKKKCKEMKIKKEEVVEKVKK